MRIVVFSDVHGNLPAFETMLKHAGTPDAYICLGDLVNYGPWSNECVDLALSLPACQYIIGNHEELFISGIDKVTHSLSDAFFQVCIRTFSRRNEILTFRETYEAFGYCFRHTVERKYVRQDTNILLDANYVIGHSHHQFTYTNNGFTLHSTGSVGQNRRYINIINYLVLDTDKLEFTSRSIPYDVGGVIREMKQRKYPPSCIDYYLAKEIL